MSDFIGPALSAISGIFGSKAKKAAQKEQLRLQEQNRQDNIARYEDQKKIAFDERDRDIAEVLGLNKDLLQQREDYNTDIEGQRASLDATFERLLNLIQSGGQADTSDLQGVLASRARARDRGEVDALEAVPQRRRYETELAQGGPSAETIASLLEASGANAISRSFEDSGNTAAMELSRTGGDTGRAFSNLARQRADALKQNSLDSRLAAITGAEQIASTRAGRLSPIISAMSARATATPDASAEAGASQLKTNARMNQVDSTTKLSSLAGLKAGLAKLSPQALQRSRALGSTAMPTYNIDMKTDPGATNSGMWSAAFANMSNVFKPTPTG